MRHDACFARTSPYTGDEHMSTRAPAGALRLPRGNQRRCKPIGGRVAPGGAEHADVLATGEVASSGGLALLAALPPSCRRL